MMFRALTAALAVVAAPIALGAQPTTQPRDDSTRKICRTDGTAGSRLGGVRRCRTKAEWDAEKAEARQVVDRVQNMRPIYCAPPQPC
jgi:hypothetical protein